MARYARKRSESQVYHVMLRGIDRMPIFIANADRLRFLETMDRMKMKGEYELYAYCLMDNHVHLLIKEEEEAIQETMKRIGVSYAYYFNKKHDRVGHVFQDRYRSETIEDDSYLLAAVRYIHNNPVKAGLVKKVVDYPWSSYQEYIKYGKDSAKVDARKILSMFSENETTAIRSFEEFSTKTAEENFIEVDNKLEKPEKPRINATFTVEEILKKHGYHLDDIRNIQDKKNRNKILREIREKTEVSIRELSRALGISKDIIFRA